MVDAQVKALLAEGLSRPQIAQRLGFTYHAVRLACDRLGIPRRGAGGRPPRDASHEQANILNRCRDWATRAGLFFRTARGMHYIYDEPIAEFMDARAALAFLMSKTRRGAALRLHRLHHEPAAMPMHSLGAAAAHENMSMLTVGENTGMAAADVPSVSSAAVFSIVLVRVPQLSGLATLRS